MFSVLGFYVIVGLTRLLEKVPVIGARLPLKLRYGLSVLIIGRGVVEVVYLVIASTDAIVALAPRYQKTLLAGSFLSVLFPAIMAIVQFGTTGEFVAVLLPLIAIQFVIGNFLDPYIMGNSLNLSPFVILVALAAWSSLWGVAGAFLAVPITTIMAIVFSGFDGTRPIAVMLSRSGRV